MAQFTNQAQLSYNGVVTASNIAVGELIEELSISKSPVSTSYTAGDDVTYVISVVNGGTVDYNNLTITDNLGEYTVGTATAVPLSYVNGTLRYYINGVLQPTPAGVSEGPPLTVTGISVPAGGNATIIYEANINQFAPLEIGSTVVNTAAVNGAGLTTATADATLTVNNDPILSITKSINPVPVAENGVLTYTFLIQNTGNEPATATDNVVITDTFNPVLSNLNVTFNGNTWAPTTNYTYNAGTGLFTSAPSQITVPAATYTQDQTTGAVTVTPGVSTLVVSGTV